MLDTIAKYNNAIVQNILELSYEKKCIFALSYAVRQKNLVLQFDEIYGEQLLELFDYNIKIGISYINRGDINLNNILDIIARLKTIIPDTEEYSKVEGSYVQNAIISLIYLFDFFTTKNITSFSYSIEKVLESIDIVNYDKNKDYDHQIVMEHEIKILSTLLCILDDSSNNDIIESSINFANNECI
jgi:hypothetical protein